MAKKDKKKSKKKDNPGADAVGAVRTAVERTFQATAGSAQSTRTRAQDLVDEVAGAAGRLREMIEQVGVLEDLKGLRGEVESLARRVAALEGGSKPKPKPATRSRAAASRSGTAAKSASGSGTRAKASSAKPATRAKPASGGTRNPAASRSTSSSRSTASRSTSSRSAKKTS